MLQTLTTSTLAASQVYPTVIQPATYIRCLSGNGSFTMRGYDNQGGTALNVTGWTAGLSIGPLPKPIVKLEIENGSTSQQIQIVYGDSDVQDNRLVGTVNITGGLNSRGLSPNTVTEGAVSATGAADLIWTANSSGGFGALYNADAAITIYYGHTTGVTSSNGIPLVAGAFIDGLPCALDLYVIVASGTVSVRYKQYSFT